MWGGKPRDKGRHNLKNRADRKTPVVAMVQRGGNVRAMTMPKVNGKNLKRVIYQNIHKSARIITDDAALYKGLHKDFEGGHDTINHSAGKYVEGDITTNTVEGFFSILKRGMIGTFHAVSKKHLHRYVSEFEYRYNTRHLNDGERTVIAIRKADGKRLYYKDPINRASQV